MKLLLLSDLHLMWDRPRCRLDEDMARTCLGKMTFVLDYAAREGCAILQAGDFFDKPRSWHLLVAYMRLLDEYREVPVHCVFGQHDQYYRTREDTLLVALSIAGRVTILGKNPVVYDVQGGRTDKLSYGRKGYIKQNDRKVCVYGCGYGEDEIPEVLDRGKWVVNVFVAHRMVIRKKIWPGQEDYELADRFLKKYDDFDLILLGDSHQKLVYADEAERMVCNSGCLIRKDTTLLSHKPGFFVYDTEAKSMDWVDIPHEPPERCMSDKHLRDTEESNEMLQSFVSSVNGDEIETEGSFEANLDKFVKQHGIADDIQLLISQEMSK